MQIKGKKMIVKIFGSMALSLSGAVVVGAAVLSGNFLAAFLLGSITVMSVSALWILE